MCVIKCPNCGYEYLGGEIFIPNNLIGQPKNIIRNSLGEILGYEGIEPSDKESYVCDYCNNEFNIVAKVNYIIESETSQNIDNSPMQISLFD